MRVRAGLAAATAALALIAACEGSNLFTGEVSNQGPSIQLQAPTSVQSGSQFTVVAAANAPDGIDFIEIRASGAATDSLRQEFTGTTAVLSLPLIASVGLGATVQVVAFVQDEAGRRSPNAVRTINVTP